MACISKKMEEKIHFQSKWKDGWIERASERASDVWFIMLRRLESSDICYPILEQNQLTLNELLLLLLLPDDRTEKFGLSGGIITATWECQIRRKHLRYIKVYANIVSDVHTVLLDPQGCLDERRRGSSKETDGSTMNYYHTYRNRNLDQTFGGKTSTTTYVHGSAISPCYWYYYVIILCVCQFIAEVDDLTHPSRSENSFVHYH